MQSRTVLALHTAALKKIVRIVGHACGRRCLIHGVTNHPRSTTRYGCVTLDSCFANACSQRYPFTALPLQGDASNWAGIQPRGQAPARNSNHIPVSGFTRPPYSRSIQGIDRRVSDQRDVFLPRVSILSQATACDCNARLKTGPRQRVSIGLPPRPLTMTFTGPARPHSREPIGSGIHYSSLTSDSIGHFLLTRRGGTDRQMYPDASARAVPSTAMGYPSPSLLHSDCFWIACCLARPRSNIPCLPTVVRMLTVRLCTHNTRISAGAHFLAVYASSYPVSASVHAEAPQLCRDAVHGSTTAGMLCDSSECAPKSKRIMARCY